MFKLNNLNLQEFDSFKHLKVTYDHKSEKMTYLDWLSRNTIQLQNEFREFEYQPHSSSKQTVKYVAIPYKVITQKYF